jgi:polyhydroxyalkanoate synthesis regulator phasin
VSHHIIEVFFLFVMSVIFTSLFSEKRGRSARLHLSQHAMRLDDPFLCRHPAAALVGAFLTALTITTVLELIDDTRSPKAPVPQALKAPSSDSGPLLDAFGLPQAAATDGNQRGGTTSSEDMRMITDFISAIKESRDDVVRAGVMLENAFQHADQLLSSTQRSLDSAEREINRLERVRARETPPDDQTQQGADQLSEDSHSKGKRLHSGYLQSFESIAFCEKIIASRLDTKSVTHHEKRAWRQRIMGVLHQADTTALGGIAGQREKIEYLENRVAAILSKWGQNFKKSGSPGVDDTAASSPTHILEMDEVGYDPIYRSLFAVDAAPPSSEEEGIRLHQLYNVQPGR